MGRGRKPTPSRIRELNGNPGRRPIGEEPPVTLGIPSCPSWLSPTAKREYRRVAKELHRVGILAEIDQQILAAYASAYARWRQAEEQLQREALTIGNRRHPAVNVVHDALAEMKSFAAELGLTPAARVKLAKMPSEAKDDFEDFLEAVPESKADAG